MLKCQPPDTGKHRKLFEHPRASHEALRPEAEVLVTLLLAEELQGKEVSSCLHVIVSLTLLRISYTVF